MKSPAIHSLSWVELERLISLLAEEVRRDGVPDVLVAIQRGGLVPGVLLSHDLNVRQLLSFNISRTVHDGVNAPKTAPVLGANVSFDVLAGKDVLLVDDVAGSGTTVTAVQRALIPCSPRRVRSLVCVVNRDNWDTVNLGDPGATISYVGQEVNGWVVFPWEKECRFTDG